MEGIPLYLRRRFMQPLDGTNGRLTIESSNA
jgi:hypothetical protein